MSKNNNAIWNGLWRAHDDQLCAHETRIIKAECDIATSHAAHAGAELALQQRLEKMEDLVAQLPPPWTPREGDKVRVKASARHPSWEPWTDGTEGLVYKVREFDRTASDPAATISVQFPYSKRGLSAYLFKPVDLEPIDNRDVIEKLRAEVAEKDRVIVERDRTISRLNKAIRALGGGDA